MTIKGIEISYKGKLLIAFPLFAGDTYIYPEIVGMNVLVIPPGSIFKLITKTLTAKDL